MRLLCSFVIAISAIVALAGCSEKPENTRKQRGRQVLIDLSQQHAWLMDGGKILNDTPVTTGKKAHRTPSGRFVIRRKERFHQSATYGSYLSPTSHRVVVSGVDRRRYYGVRDLQFEGAAMNYFMEFAPGIAMHAGRLTSFPSSHGCVRLPPIAAKRFFELLDVGCAVRIKRSGVTLPKDGSPIFLAGE